MEYFNQVIPFLRELSQNNNKIWFDNHRLWYLQARNQMIQIASGIIDGLWLIDPAIGKPEPQKCLFRQNRDIRFSTNKNPYKTTMGAYFAPGGKHRPTAGYYLHLEPGASFMGGGLYHPEKEQLQKVRREIYFNANGLLEILNNPTFSKTFGSLMDEKLKRPPVGYPSDFPHIEWLKYTSFVVSRPLNNETFSPDELVSQALETFAIMSPFIAFLNHALYTDPD